MFSLTTEQAALAIGVRHRVLDNLLAREGRYLLPQGRRGRARRLPASVIERVALAFLIARDTGAGVERALELAEAVLRSADSEIAIGKIGRLRFDLDAFRRALRDAMADAVAELVPAPRGRPRRPA